MRVISKGQENKYKDFEPKLVEWGKIGSRTFTLHEGNFLLEFLFSLGRPTIY
jgi:hypothetical protein